MNLSIALHFLVSMRYILIIVSLSYISNIFTPNFQKKVYIMICRKVKCIWQFFTKISTIWYKFSIKLLILVERMFYFVQNKKDLFYYKAVSSSQATSLATDTSYAILVIGISIPSICLLYSLLWIRPSIYNLVPTGNLFTNWAFLPHAIHGI